MALNKYLFVEWMLQGLAAMAGDVGKRRRVKVTGNAKYMENALLVSFWMMLLAPPLGGPQKLLFDRRTKTHYRPQSDLYLNFPGMSGQLSEWWNIKLLDRGEVSSGRLVCRTLILHLGCTSESPGEL